MSKNDYKRIGTVDIIMTALALFALTLFLTSFVFDLSPDQEKLFGAIDLGICVVFITELVFRFSRSISKKHCLRESWADILGSIPTTEAEIRIIRAFRLFRVVRVARVARVAKLARVAKVAKVPRSAKALKLTRKLPKLRKTVRKIRKRKREA